MHELSEERIVDLAFGMFLEKVTQSLRTGHSFSHFFGSIEECIVSMNASVVCGVAIPLAS